MLFSRNKKFCLETDHSVSKTEVQAAFSKMLKEGQSYFVRQGFLISMDIGNRNDSEKEVNSILSQL
jgi:hypothetical protein